MAFYNHRLPDGSVVQAPLSARPEEVDAWARKQFPEAYATAPSEKRAASNPFRDIPGSVVSGIGSLVQFPGQVGTLFGASPDNAVVRAGKAVSEFGQDIKSEGLKDRERKLALIQQEVEGKGLGQEALAALKAYADDPYMTFNKLVELLPQLVVTVGAGGAARLGVRALAPNIAEKGLERAAIAGASGAGASMQAASVGDETYRRVFEAAKAAGLSDEEADARARTEARKAAAKAGAVSAATMALLPGAEKAILTRGRPGMARGAARTGTGEAAQEGIEEGSGTYFAGVGEQSVDPTVDPTAGAGFSAASGAVLGGLTGVGTGAYGGAREADAAQQLERAKTAQERQLAAEEERKNKEAEEAKKQTPEYVIQLDSRYKAYQAEMKALQEQITAFGKVEKGSSEDLQRKALIEQQKQLREDNKDLVAEHAQRAKDIKRAEAEARVAGMDPYEYWLERNYGPQTERPEVPELGPDEYAATVKTPTTAEPLGYAAQRMQLMMEQGGASLEEYADALMADYVEAEKIIKSRANIPFLNKEESQTVKAYMKEMLAEGRQELTSRQQDLQTAATQPTEDTFAYLREAMEEDPYYNPDTFDLGKARGQMARAFAFGEQPESRETEEEVRAREARDNKLRPLREEYVAALQDYPQKRGTQEAAQARRRIIEAKQALTQGERELLPLTQTHIEAETTEDKDFSGIEDLINRALGNVAGTELESDQTLEQRVQRLSEIRDDFVGKFTELMAQSAGGQPVPKSALDAAKREIAVAALAEIKAQRELNGLVPLQIPDSQFVAQFVRRLEKDFTDKSARKRSDQKTAKQSSLQPQIDALEARAMQLTRMLTRTKEGNAVPTTLLENRALAQEEKDRLYGMLELPKDVVDKMLAERNALLRRAQQMKLRSDPYFRYDQEFNSVLDRQINNIQARLREITGTDVELDERRGMGAMSAYKAKDPTQQEEAQRLVGTLINLHIRRGRGYGGAEIDRIAQNIIDGFTLRGQKLADVQKKAIDTGKGQPRRITGQEGFTLGRQLTPPEKKFEATPEDAALVRRMREEEIADIDEAVTSGRYVGEQAERADRALQQLISRIDNPVTQEDVTRAREKFPQAQPDQPDLFREGLRQDLQEQLKERDRVKAQEPETKRRFGTALAGMRGKSSLQDAVDRLAAKLGKRPTKVDAGNQYDKAKKRLEEARAELTALKKRIEEAEAGVSGAQQASLEAESEENKAKERSIRRTLNAVLSRLNQAANGARATAEDKPFVRPALSEAGRLRKFIDEELRPLLKKVPYPITAINRRLIQTRLAQLNGAMSQAVRTETNLQNFAKRQADLVAAIEKNAEERPISASEQRILNKRDSILAEYEAELAAANSDVASLEALVKQLRKEITEEDAFSSQLQEENKSIAAKIKEAEQRLSQLLNSAEQVPSLRGTGIKLLREAGASVGPFLSSAVKIKQYEKQIGELRNTLRKVDKDSQLAKDLQRKIAELKDASTRQDIGRLAELERELEIVKNSSGRRDDFVTIAKIQNLQSKIKQEIEKLTGIKEKTPGQQKFVDDAKARYKKSTEEFEAKQRRLEQQFGTPETRSGIAPVTKVTGTYGKTFDEQNKRSEQTADARAAKSADAFALRVEAGLKEPIIDFDGEKEMRIGIPEAASSGLRFKLGQWLRSKGFDEQADRVEDDATEVTIQDWLKGKGRLPKRQQAGLERPVSDVNIGVSRAKKGEGPTVAQAIKVARAQFKSAVEQGQKETAIRPQKNKGNATFNTGVPESKKRTRRTNEEILNERLGLGPMSEGDTDSDLFAAPKSPTTKMSIAAIKAAQRHPLNGMTFPEASAWLIGNIGGELNQALVRRVAKAVENAGGSIEVSTEFDDIGPGMYQHGQKKISLSPAIFKDPAQLAEVLLHELTHAATVSGLELDEQLRRDMYQLMRRVREWLKTPEGKQYIKENPNTLTNGEVYGVTDIFEFASETFASPSFQKLLRQVPQEKENVFSRFVRAIARMLGFTGEKELGTLAEAIELVDQAMGANWMANAAVGVPSDATFAAPGGFIAFGEKVKKLFRKSTQEEKTLALAKNTVSALLAKNNLFGNVIYAKNLDDLASIDPELADKVYEAQENSPLVIIGTLEKAGGLTRREFSKFVLSSAASVYLPPITKGMSGKDLASLADLIGNQQEQILAALQKILPSAAKAAFRDMSLQDYLIGEYGDAVATAAGELSGVGDQDSYTEKQYAAMAVFDARQGDAPISEQEYNEAFEKIGPDLLAKMQEKFEATKEAIKKALGAADKKQDAVVREPEGTVVVFTDNVQSSQQLVDAFSRQVGRDVFFAPKRQYQDNDIKAASDIMIGKDKPLLDRLRANATGLAFRVRMIENDAALKEALKKGDPNLAIQYSYDSMMFNQRNHILYETVLNGAPTREWWNPDKKDFQKTEVKGGASLKRVSELLAEVKGYGNHQATTEAFTLLSLAKRAETRGWAKVFGDLPPLDAPKGANDATKKYFADENKKRVEENKRRADARAKADELAEQLNEGNSPFAAAYKEYQDYNKEMLRFAMQAGVISEESFRELSREGNYTPLFRKDKVGNLVLELDSGREITVGRIQDEARLEELIGGTGQVMDFFTASVRNASVLIDASLQNITARSAAFSLRAMGAARQVGKGAANPNIIEFRVKGEKDLQRFEVDTEAFGIPTELVVKGMAGVPASLPGWARLMGMPAQLLRKTVTRNPLYMFRTLIRDPLNAWLVTGAKIEPVTDTVKELGKALSGKADKTLERRGITGGMIFSEDFADLARIRDAAAKASPWSVGYWAAKLDEMVIAADAVTRRNVYNGAIKEGASEIQATLAAYESMPFSKRGTSPSMRFLNHMVPFLSATVQGWDVLYRSAFKNDMPLSERVNVRDKLLLRGGILAGISMLYAITMADEEEYPRYANANTSERLNNWFLPIPGTKEMLKLPVPFELGIIFKMLPEALVRGMQEDKQMSKELGNLAGAALNMIPNIVIPQAVLPAAEAMANYSLFTGNPIENQGLGSIDIGQRTGKNTAELSKLLGFDFEVAGRQFGVSPVMLEYMLSQYTAGLYPAFAAMVDTVLPAPTATKPDRSLAEMPLFRSTLVQEDAGGKVNRLYEEMERFSRTNATFKKLLETDPEKAQAYMQEKGEEVVKGEMSNKFRAAINKFNEVENIIRRDPNMPSDQKKKAIDNIKRLRSQLADQFSDALAA